MPEGIDHPKVATRNGVVEISWPARELLLYRLRRLDPDTTPFAVAAFQAAGASRPVKLNRKGKTLVLDALNEITNHAGGLSGLDPGLAQLQHNLVDELGPGE